MIQIAESQAIVGSQLQLTILQGDYKDDPVYLDKVKVSFFSCHRVLFFMLKI